MWWAVLLVIWCLINIFGGLFIWFEQDADHWLSLFFPIPLYLISISEEYTLPGRIIIIGLGNLLFLSFTILNLLITIVLMLCCSVILLLNQYKFY